jgi:hypothetical protein
LARAKPEQSRSKTITYEHIRAQRNVFARKFRHSVLGSQSEQLF